MIDPAPAQKKLFGVALGNMGLSFAELADMTPFLFDLKFTGWLDERKEDENMFRKMAFLMTSIGVGKDGMKGVTLDKLWPARGSGSAPVKKKKFSQISRRLLKQYNEKRDGRTAIGRTNRKN